jgi:hypothetical protein
MMRVAIQVDIAPRTTHPFQYWHDNRGGRMGGTRFPRIDKPQKFVSAFTAAIIADTLDGP